MPFASICQAPPEDLDAVRRNVSVWAISSLVAAGAGVGREEEVG